jgi:hypothetical protein
VGCSLLTCHLPPTFALPTVLPMALSVAQSQPLGQLLQPTAQTKHMWLQFAPLTTQGLVRLPDTSTPPMMCFDPPTGSSPSWHPMPAERGWNAGEVRCQAGSRWGPPVLVAVHEVPHLLVGGAQQRQRPQQLLQSHLRLREPLIATTAGAGMGGDVARVQQAVQTCNAVAAE